MALFEQIDNRDYKPPYSGWYHTDKGELYYFKDEDSWSCRMDKISEEHPNLWYEYKTQ